MSLVGPRPCTTVEFARYEPRQKDRVNIQPGITGYWQVNGKNRTTFEEMMDLDLHYAKHKSLLLDLKIIALTIPAILMQVCELKGRPKRAPRTPLFEGVSASKPLDPQ